MAKTKKFLKRRLWLRPFDGYGDQTTIHMDVEASKWSGKFTLDSTFGIRDCSNYVSLDIYADSDRTCTKQRTAVQKLIKELTLLDSKLEEAHQYILTNGGWGKHIEDEES